jgi:hypothetical protein
MMDFGETIREAGAYMLDSQEPGKAVSIGPVQVVFFQQVCARAVLAKKKNALVREMKPLIAILRRY